jgi:bZIP-type transcription factor MBZ1
MYAALASQTLLGKLGSAFWDAFSGGSTSPSASTASSFGSAAGGANVMSRQWDADKVRKVLEGKAVVRVVDVVESNPSAKASASAAAKLPVAGSSPSPSSSSAKQPRAGDKCEKEKCIMAMADILEESMRSLSLGKK